MVYRAAGGSPAGCEHPFKNRASVTITAHTTAALQKPEVLKIDFMGLDLLSRKNICLSGIKARVLYSGHGE
jgi:hypothetical protein